MMRVLRVQFEAQKTSTLEALETVRPSKSFKTKDLNDLLDWRAADKAMADALSPVLLQIVLDFGRDGMAQIGLDASAFKPFAMQVVDYYKSRSIKIATDVNDETEKQLRASLAEGFRENDTPLELRARVESVFGAGSTYRADRIARTETTRAQGFADVEAWRQSGVVSGKEWYTARDERVCPWCRSMDGTVTGLEQNFFDKGDVLTVDNKPLKMNYDDTPTPPIHTQCRCVMLPVV